MREIKFRAWHEGAQRMFSAEEMAEDQLTMLPTGKFINVSGTSIRLSQIYDNRIPLQYTGLKDKNGKEIYESDILAAEDGRSSSIEYDAPHFIVRHHYEGGSDFVAAKHKFEVIGNVYENFELLTSIP